MQCRIHGYNMELNFEISLDQLYPTVEVEPTVKKFGLSRNILFSKIK